MIEYVHGDIFDSGAEALVNPVNCFGICGKGLAKQFKERYPWNFGVYRNYCLPHHYLAAGHVLWVKDRIHDFRIANLATKYHWRENSRLEYVRMGMSELALGVLNLDIHSLAIPPLGCGCGNLQWEEVKPIIERSCLEEFKCGVRVMVYEP